MTARDLLQHFVGRGFRLVPTRGKIRVSPADRLTEADRDLIRRNKPELLLLLASPEAEWDRAEAERLLVELRRVADDVLDPRRFGGVWPLELAHAVGNLLAVAAGVVARHPDESYRGGDPLQLLRDTRRCLRQVAENWKARAGAVSGRADPLPRRT